MIENSRKVAGCSLGRSYCEVHNESFILIDPIDDLIESIYSISLDILSVLTALREV